MTRRTLVGLLLWLMAATVFAHELQANRLTLVLRDRNHLSMTFFIGYTDALHRALAPRRTFREFALVYSAMKPQELEKELLRAQAKFQNDTRLTLSAGKQANITNWKWPDAARVQVLLQESVMQSVVAPSDHSHEAPVDIHAEVIAPQNISSVTIRLPEEFQRVLVVSYRPSQVWVESNTPSPAIKF